MKRPSFQFYPDDWAGNSNLRRCTHEEKGIWMDVLCVLHDQDEYGIARWPLDELAQATGTTKAKLKRLVSKGVLKGADTKEVCEPFVFVPRSGRKNGDPVTLIEAQEGPLWYSSRMVTDEYKRAVRGGLVDTSKATPNHSPKGGIGEGMDDTPKPTPKGAPHPSPSRARPSSPSPSPSPIKNINPKAAASIAAAEEGVAEEPPPPPLEPDKFPPIPDEAPTRATQIAVLLKRNGADPRTHPSSKGIVDLAEMQATDAQVLAALETAKQRRAESQSAQPVTASYLLPIVRDLQASPPARASPGGSSRQRFDPSEYVNRNRLSRQSAQETAHDHRTIDVDAERVD